ncbi:MAG: hypothetical protein IH988_11370, partial [Planctomycetes bacterium]|nr:hypothetical protein [Planctomycetota bacterium]
FVRKVMGHPVTDDQMKRILRALEFTVDDRGDSMRVTVPSFRATKDVQTEVDLIEEICRYVGFGNITPSLPEVTVRCFQPNPAHTLEHATLRHWCESCGYHEIYGYIWDDVNWNRQLGYAPSDSHELRNPAGAGLQFLRQSLIPGLLAAADRNRHHFDEFHLAELGSVFQPRPAAIGGMGDPGGPDGDTAADTGERKRIGLLAARRSKKAEADLLAELKGAVETWALRALGAPLWFDRADAQLPWEHPIKTAMARVQGKSIGRLGVVPLPLRQRIDDHLAAWSMVWAELDLVSALEVTSPVEQLPPIPSHPQVDLDFSFLVRAADRFKDVSRKIAEFRHPLLQRVSFLDSYEGKSTGSDRRSLTFHFSLGAESRTLTDEDLATFRTAFQSHLDRLGYTLRS